MLKRLLFSLLPERAAYAHCDVPCGIYTPEAARTAAKTILVMVQKIKALKKPEGENSDELLTYKNNLTRMVWTKEEHARVAKHELTILWADYFKPEDLKMFPDLHDIFWNALKLCSKNKQSVDEKTAQELTAVVEKIAQMFDTAEKEKARASHT